MKTSTKVWIGVGIAVLLLIIWFFGAYNSLISKQASVTEAFANIQAQYQRRADLIPNLVNTVQGVVKFETETQTKIAEIRTQAAALKNEIAAAKNANELQTAGDKVDGLVTGFSALNINVENYPDLKASQNFLALQDELAGTENRVAVARTRYNEAVKVYNVAIRRIPTNIIAGMFGFTAEQSFQAKAGTENAPEVKF